MKKPDKKPLLPEEKHKSFSGMPTNSDSSQVDLNPKASAGLRVATPREPVQFRSLEQRLRIHGSDQIVYIFKSRNDWLVHLLRHFGNQAESWNAAFGLDLAKTIFNVCDRVPGKTAEEKVSQLPQILEAAEKGDDHSKSILTQALGLYSDVASFIAGDLRASALSPRYAFFPEGDANHSIPTAIFIGVNSLALMIIAGYDLRTCYYPPNCKAGIQSLLTVQSFVFRYFRIAKSGSQWIAGCGKPVFPHTEKSMNWPSQAFIGSWNGNTLPPPKGKP